MLNKRHKVILFVMVVMTGSALLAGATLNEALGMLMLGAALAWLVGSQSVLRICNYLRRVPGKSWPWVRLLLLMAIAGLLLGAVTFWSHFNSFLVISCMSVFGIIISPIGKLPTQRVWSKVVFWIIAVTVFFFGYLGCLNS